MLLSVYVCVVFFFLKEKHFYDFYVLAVVLQAICVCVYWSAIIMLFTAFSAAKIILSAFYEFVVVDFVFVVDV